MTYSEADHFLLYRHISYNLKGSLGVPGKVVTMRLGGHGFKTWKQPRAEMRGKAATIGPYGQALTQTLRIAGALVYWGALFILLIICAFKLNQHLFQHFHMKDLGRLRYSLGIEVTPPN